MDMMRQGDRRACSKEPSFPANACGCWLLLDYPWGLLAFVAIATLYGLR